MPKKKQAPAPNTVKIKKGDIVRVIAGRDAPKKVDGKWKNTEGRVLEVDRSRGRLLVEGVNMVKRHTRPNPQRQIKGGIAEREAPIHVSNVMVLTSGGIPTRVSYRVDETPSGAARKTRVARRNNENLDRKG